MKSQISRNMLITGTAALLSFAGVGTVQADVVVYDFGTVGSPSWAADTTANVSANDFSTTAIMGPHAGGAWNGSSNGIDEVNGNPAPAFAQKPRGGDDQAAAFANDAYWTFTVTPDSGFSMDLESLTFDLLTRNSIRPIGYYLASSVDGFDTPIGSAVNDLHQADWDTKTFDLSGSQYQGLTDPVEFRLYQWDQGLGGSSGSAWNFDNVTLNGDVVPEPASLALLSAGGLLMLVRRRR